MRERHKHADLIHAWAEGADIQIKRWDGKWTHTDKPSWFATDEFRVTPKIPQWFENIPEKGILCWVGDFEDEKRNQIRRIVAFNGAKEFSKFQAETKNFVYATPLTNDEIKQFLREDAS